MESPTAWDSLYNESLDDSKVPQCAEKLMQIIAGITGKSFEIVL